MTPEQLAEYNQMRGEILARATLHHQQLVYAVMMQLICALFVVWLNYSSAHWATTELFLLLAPIIFAGLAFNYQANQCTMESVARYLNQQYGSFGLQWEDFFSKERAKNKLVSFTKALPIVWPLFIPVVLWATVGWPSGILNSGLAGIDLILLIILLVNFRYKLNR